jgi:hypothetical protein
MKGAFRATGHPELGLLLFYFPVPWQAASLPDNEYCARSSARCWLRLSVWSLCGFFLVTERSFWQELAWLLSAVFWCALGALFLFICAWLETRRKHASGSEPSQANKPRFSFAQASKSVQPPMCF